MSEVVLIYAEADRGRAALAAERLGAAGYAITRVPEPAPPSDPRRDLALTRAACVVTLWSDTADKDARLRQRALVADRRHAMISARLDGTPVPDDFDHRGGFDLADWKGDGDHQGFQALLRAVRDQVDKPPGLTREEFLQSFFFFGGLHFGLTLDDAAQRFGLPSESSETMLAYEHGHAEGPGLVLVQTHDESKLINYVVVHGQGGIEFLARHNVIDPRLVFIGMHKDDIFKVLGAPTQNIGELEDGRICFGYNTVVGVEASAPDGATARFGLVIYVLFYVTSRDIPFCGAMSVQWDPVPFPDEGEAEGS